MKKSLGPKTLVLPTPVWLVGTYDSREKPNFMAAAWGGVVCSKPPAVGISIRKATYTYEAIVATKAYTISVMSESRVREADYAGIVSGRDTNKFEHARLTAVASQLVHAPFVSEAPLLLECKLIHTLELGLHTQFIGEILDVKAEENVLGENGSPDAALVKAFSYDPGSRNYFTTGPLLAKAFSIGKELVENPPT